MYATMMIKARTLKEAMRTAVEDAALPDGAYVEDSFRVDEEILPDFYPRRRKPRAASKETR